VQADNQVLKHELADLDVELAGRRDVLTQLKHERDVLRADNHERKQSRGVVSSEELLIDYEKRRQHILAQKEELARLQARHATLIGKTSSTKAAVATIAGF
jgi:cell division protein FtsB